jgi:hypothetical protein
MLRMMVLTLWAWGCDHPVSTPSVIPSPTPTPDVSIGILIVAGLNVVGVGATTALTATGYPAFPSPTRNYPALDFGGQVEWVSSDPSVASICCRGLVTGRAAGATEISASYKGRSYSLPLLVVERGSSQSLSTYVGTWSGEGTLTCQRLSGEGRSVCDPSPFGGPQTVRHPIQLTLALAGGTLAGTLRLYQSPMTGPVQAALLDTRQLGIGGTLGGEHGTIVQLREWRFGLTRDGRLVGTVIEDRAFVNVYSPQLLRERLEVDGLTRDE